MQARSHIAETSAASRADLQEHMLQQHMQQQRMRGNERCNQKLLKKNMLQPRTDFAEASAASKAVRRNKCCTNICCNNGCCSNERCNQTRLKSQLDSAGRTCRKNARGGPAKIKSRLERGRHERHKPTPTRSCRGRDEPDTAPTQLSMDSTVPEESS